MVGVQTLPQIFQRLLALAMFSFPEWNLWTSCLRKAFRFRVLLNSLFREIVLNWKSLTLFVFCVLPSAKDKSLPSTLIVIWGWNLVLVLVLTLWKIPVCQFCRQLKKQKNNNTQTASDLDSPYCTVIFISSLLGSYKFWSYSLLSPDSSPIQPLSLSTQLGVRFLYF